MYEMIKKPHQVRQLSSQGGYILHDPCQGHGAVYVIWAEYPSTGDQYRIGYDQARVTCGLHQGSNPAGPLAPMTWYRADHDMG